MLYLFFLFKITFTICTWKIYNKQIGWYDKENDFDTLSTFTTNSCAVNTNKVY